jgi:uncharacterized membrane protein YeaQ/YmgE (transglycosylase-associated protein family)
MIGMNFISFLILLIISIVVSGVLHFVVKIYIIPGWRSYASKVLIGWIGAWLGSPVFGYWPHPLSLNYQEVWIVPAILGALAIEVFAVDFIKTCVTIFKGTA